MTDIIGKTGNNHEAFRIDEAETELLRYFEQTEEIRRLSAPNLRKIDGAENYRKTLLENYKRIGELAKDNVAILSAYFYPMLDEDRELTSDEVRLMRLFSNTLNNAYHLNNMDSPLIYKQAKRLLQDAERKPCPFEHVHMLVVHLFLTCNLVAKLRYQFSVQWHSFVCHVDYYLLHSRMFL